MKKSELRKLIRGIIKEQTTWGETMTADCSQYNFPQAVGGNTIAGQNIGSTEWCNWIMNYYDSGFYPNLLTPWCNGEAESPWGPFPIGFVDMMGSVGETSQCGMCYCLEQMNTGDEGGPGSQPDTLGPAPGPAGQTMGTSLPPTSPVRGTKKPIRRQKARRKDLEDPFINEKVSKILKKLKFRKK